MRGAWYGYIFGIFIEHIISEVILPLYELVTGPVTTPLGDICIAISLVLILIMIVLFFYNKAFLFFCATIRDVRMDIGRVHGSGIDAGNDGREVKW